MSQAVRIEEQAARYLARRQEAGWSAEDQSELDAWLGEATAHEVAFFRMEYGWGKVDRMVVLRGGVKGKRSPRPKPPQAGAEGTRGRWRGFSIAASIVITGAALFVWRSGMLEGLFYPSYTTDIGGHQTVPLADGSRIELNTNTRVRADINAAARKVWVDRGEAYFDIAPDPARPFVVYAGERRVTVLGTKFSVRRDKDRVRVVVTEGRIQLEDINASKPAAPQIIKDGDTAIAAAGASAHIESSSAEKAARELSWRQGILTFDQTSLAAAAREFNRYNRRQLMVADAAAEVRIGGSFEAVNLEAFVRLLQQGFGLRVQQEGEDYSISN